MRKFLNYSLSYIMNEEIIKEIDHQQNIYLFHFFVDFRSLFVP